MLDSTRSTNRSDCQVRTFRADYSALMWAARTTFPHLSVSSAISLPNSVGERTSTVAFRLANRAFVLGSMRIALISVLSFSTMSLAVFLYRLHTGLNRNKAPAFPHKRWARHRTLSVFRSDYLIREGADGQVQQRPSRATEKSAEA